MIAATSGLVNQSAAALLLEALEAPAVGFLRETQRNANLGCATRRCHAGGARAVHRPTRPCQPRRTCRSIVEHTKLALSVAIKAAGENRG
jgi:hypothetical protein